MIYLKDCEYFQNRNAYFKIGIDYNTNSIYITKTYWFRHNGYLKKEEKTKCYFNSWIECNKIQGNSVRSKYVKYFIAKNDEFTNGLFHHSML